MQLRRRTTRSPLALATVLLTALAAVAFDARAGRPRFADPSAPGAYAVGHTLFTAVDPARGDRRLPSELWYPADPEAVVGATPTRYDFQFLGLGLDSPAAFEDVPVSRDMAFPLIVFSHGNGGVSWQSTFLMERLASHGFVVVSPNHTGNTVNDLLGGTAVPFRQSAYDRPQDVSFLIDWLSARSLDPLDPFYWKINPFVAGVAGHSFGGFTTLASASGYSDPTLGPDVPPDPRVRAIAPIAPASGALDDARLASIELPTFLLSGTLDTTTPIVPQTTRPFTLVAGRPIYRADVVGAEHLHFANVCDIGVELTELGVSDDAIEQLIDGFLDTCRPPALPIEEVKEIQSFYLAAFFKRHLYGDPIYDDWLTDDYAETHEPGVTWFRLDAEASE
jgi:predicted dienelactone hydrolase